jgi:hypothetical protein
MTSPEGLSKQTLRIIDANLNRIGESLRLLEDIARLMLNDATLSKRLKAIRHDLEENDFPLKKQLLQASRRIPMSAPISRWSSNWEKETCLRQS